MNADDVIQQIAEAYEADRQRPKPVRIFHAVLRLLDRGQDHLKAWENIRQVIHADAALAELATPHFILAGIAHIEAAALQAAKLTETQGDSTNVTYLLNTIEADRKQPYLRGDWANAKLSVEVARQRLLGIEAVVRRIKERRDRELAHLDRRNIDLFPDWQAIEVDDLRQVFSTIEEIASELASSIAALAQISRFSLEELEPQALNDLIYFARAGFNNQSVKSPSARAETIREFDRHVRHAKDMITHLGQNGHTAPTG